jgi:hypothetical protein
MMTPHRKTLLDARKAYSNCARKVEKSISRTNLDDTLSERIVGIGAAIEWTRRAAEMDGIHYIGKNLNDSPRNQPFSELLRFSFSWFALNAIFTRVQLLSLIGTPNNPNSEYEAFCVLYNSALPTDAPIRLSELHKLLDAPTAPRLPGMPKGSSVTTLFAIHLKYLPKPGRGTTGKAIDNAVNLGNASSLDMPTLMYSFRNWSVHGNALDGCFGSRPGFFSYVCLLQETLAEVHLHTAQRLCELL